MSLKSRLERMEAREKPREQDEDAERRAWLATARVRAIENHDPDEFRAGDLLRLFRTQGRLEGATFERARDMALAWPTSPPSRWAVERVLSRMAYEGEPGTENMECPAEWREAWEAADELRERHAAVPVETLAAWIVIQHEHEAEGGEGAAPELEGAGEPHGLTDELYRAAVGPDADGIGEPEEARRLREILEGDYYGERAWHIQRQTHEGAVSWLTRDPRG